MVKAIRLGTTEKSHGRNKELIECPECHHKQEVYMWSFAGGGKLCPCGIKLGR